MDITTTIYKKPDIMVTSMDNAFGQDKINTVFRSLYDQMTSYKPDTTANDFADFCYSGKLTGKYNGGKVPKPLKEVPLIGITDSGATLNVGYISTSGDVVFKDIDSIKKTCLCYDLSWQDVQYGPILQAADFGNATFQIGGDGPTLLCNCLFKPCVIDDLNCSILNSVIYNYDYQYTYCNYPFYWNDGTRQSNIMGWYIVGGQCQFVTTDNWDGCCLSCNCCTCIMYENECCITPDGTVWTIHNDITSWCVYETWTKVPEIYDGDRNTYLERINETPWGCGLGARMARPAFWAWNDNNWGTTVGNGYANTMRLNGWCGCSYHDTSWMCFNRHFKCGITHNTYAWPWNPNNEYWCDCLGKCWKVNTPYDNAARDINKLYCSPVKKFMYDLHIQDRFNSGVHAIPYDKQTYCALACCYECNMKNQRTWVGGNYLEATEYYASWARQWMEIPGYCCWWGDFYPGWRTGHPSDQCFNWTSGCASYGNVLPLYFMVEGTGGGRDDWNYSYSTMWGADASINFPKYNIGGNIECNGWTKSSFPTTTLFGSQIPCCGGDLTRLQWILPCYQMSGAILYLCGCEPPRETPAKLIYCCSYDDTLYYCWDSDFSGTNYSPVWGQTPCGPTTLTYSHSWFNMATEWVYAPYSYCRLTKQYCVHRRMLGSSKFDVGNVSIRVRYKKA